MRLLYTSAIRRQSIGPPLPLPPPAASTTLVFVYSLLPYLFNHQCGAPERVDASGEQTVRGCPLTVRVSV